MLALALIMLMNPGVDAGSAQVSCDGSVVTLQASPIDPPANYLIQWDDNETPGVFLVVTPNTTTTYRVTLTDLDTSAVYEDAVRVLVHPVGADLSNDGLYNGDDQLAWLPFWQKTPDPESDADQNGHVNIFDYFYICNFDVSPPNTPPSLSIPESFTSSGDTVEIEYQLADMEQTPTLHVAAQPDNGFVTLISGALRYSADVDFIGGDRFPVYASDGYIQTPDQWVDVTVLAPDTFDNLYDDIFWPRCRACHIDAVSGGLSLIDYPTAQAAGAFVPGFPEQSPLYLRVADGSMPLGFPMLEQQDIERIRIWILKGAAP